jgi:hypothetical protein
MRSLYPILIVTATLALPAFPQALVEHSAAAAGATIGTTAGKSLSNSMDRIFGNMEENTVHAAGVTKKEEKKKEQALSAETGSAQADADDAASPNGTSKSARSRSRRAKAAARTETAATAPLIAIPAPPPPPKEPALEDLLNVKTGTKEEALTASLGRPSSRISIPDDGHLLEILRYTAGGQLLGVVRVDNGAVVSVQPVSQAR